jgi:hypothetical protein
MLRDFRIGSPVASADGHHVGTLARVIVDGATDAVLGIVVDPGLVASGNLLAPGGWSRPRERVVALERVATAEHAGVSLTCDKAAFEALPLFEHDQSSAVDPTANAGDSKADDSGDATFERGELINYGAAAFGLGAAPYLPPTTFTRDEPATAGAIDKDAAVWRVDPHERVGTVEDLLLDDAGTRLRALVVRRGALEGLVVIPAAAIAAVEDGVVRARLTDDELRDLERYHRED